MKIKQEKKGIAVQLSRWEKILSIHGDFNIPRSQIISMECRQPESSWIDLKFPGTFLPGVIKAGTYLTNRGKEFWYWVYNRPYTYVIELRDMPYKRLIIGLAHPLSPYTAS